MAGRSIFIYSEAGQRIVLSPKGKKYIMKKNTLPDFRQRQDDAAAAKKAMLTKFRSTSGPDDPASQSVAGQEKPCWQNALLAPDNGKPRCERM
jgi:hypothetical protein